MAGLVWYVSIIAINPTGRILLSRRLPGAKVGVGRFGPPGGRIESGECVLDAARRELFEETGLRATSVTPAGWKPADEHCAKCLDSPGTVLFVRAVIERFSELRNMEPTIHEEWKWYVPQVMNLPTDTWDRAQIVAIARGDGGLL